MTIPLLALGLLFGLTVRACIWDADTLAEERKKSPSVATAILEETAGPVDPKPLRERIRKLEANPRRDDPAWWNDLAGAHIRLGESRQAVELLEPVKSRFPDNYGIHANLGTAYHLLGRYADAEKEIARDLEINPDAHFGLEKFHLALLQYLVRDSNYQRRHVYVDEYSASFLNAMGPIFSYLPAPAANPGRDVSAAEVAGLHASQDDPLDCRLLAEISKMDKAPTYRANWDLAQDPKLREGTHYMAKLNPKQPACFVMLGVVSWKDHNLNLAAAAFEKAIALGTPQSDILKLKVEDIRGHIREAQKHEEETSGQNRIQTIIVSVVVAALVSCLGLLWFVIRKSFASSPGT